MGPFKKKVYELFPDGTNKWPPISVGKNQSYNQDSAIGKQ
jgi:hypothetical protein